MVAWQARPIPLLLIVAALYGVAPSTAPAFEVRYAVPNGDPRVGQPAGPGGAVARTLQGAIDRARPGDTVRLLPGVYRLVRLEDRIAIRMSGSPGRPIVVQGMGAQTVIDGGPLARAGGRAPPAEPGEGQAFFLPGFHRGLNCIEIDGAQWIVIENLTFTDCANAAVFARDSRYVTLRNARILGGAYAFLARGQGSHHFLIEDNAWTQDPAGDMWHRNHWCAYKYGALKHLNGALFGSEDIAGSVVVRSNRVAHAFNAVRMNVSAGGRRDSSLRGRLNANVHIHHNRFDYIRDNVVEPEFDSTNWWVHDNVIRNAHAWFSFDGLHGGWWYVFANRGWFDDRPSLRCLARRDCREWRRRMPAECADLHNGGRVLKFRVDGRSAPGPLYVFNNSWYLRASVAKRGRTGRFGHWNNAIEFCRPGASPVCDGPKPFFRAFTWDAGSYDFRHDLSNHPDFPRRLRAQGYPVAGVSAPPAQSLFVDPARGDLALRAGSPGRDAGCRVSMAADGTVRCRRPPKGERGPDIGAVDGAAVGRDVFYRHRDVGSYGAPPRVVHADWPPKREEGDARPFIRIVLSKPIRGGSGELRIRVVPRRGIAVISEPCALENRTMTCRLPADPPAAEPRALLLPPGITDLSGRPLTLWARNPAYVGVWR